MLVYQGKWGCFQYFRDCQDMSRCSEGENIQFRSTQRSLLLKDQRMEKLPICAPENCSKSRIIQRETSKTATLPSIQWYNFTNQTCSKTCRYLSIKNSWLFTCCFAGDAFPQATERHGVHARKIAPLEENHLVGSFPGPCLEHLQAFLGVFQSFRL